MRQRSERTKLRCESQHITDEAWYYINPASVDLVMGGKIVRLTRKRVELILSQMAIVKGKAAR